jgi:hypothetical protein
MIRRKNLVVAAQVFQGFVAVSFSVANLPAGVTASFSNFNEAATITLVISWWIDAFPASQGAFLAAMIPFAHHGNSRA